MGLGTLLLALALALGAAGFAQHDIWYAAAVAAGSGYWDLSSQPAHFRLRQSDNTRWQPTTPPPAEPSPIQKSRRRGGKGREPEAGPPQSSQLLEEPHGGPGPCPNLGRAQLDCDTAKESERQSEPARRRPAPESQLGPGRAFGRTSGPRLQTPSQSAQHTNLQVNPTCTRPTDGTGGKLHRTGPTRDEYLVRHNQPCG